MKMTDLARLAGVSVSTVSKAFSKSSEISEKQREHIFDVAKKHGCYDKYCKERYMGKVIAVICPEFKSRLYSEQLSLLEEKIKERNAVMVVSSTDFDPEKALEHLDFYAENIKADGIISICSLKTDKKFSTPIVTLSKNEHFNSVIVSEENALSEAIKLLKKNRHTKIAYIGEPHASGRRDNFVKAMKNNSITVNDDYIIVPDHRFESAGYVGMNKLLSLQNPPTAVIAAYDDIAFGAMKSIYEHGLKIPEDISIIGSDDIKESQYLHERLTSITAYNEDLAEIAVDLLFDLIEKKDSDTIKTIKISRQLVNRESVGIAKEASL